MKKTLLYFALATLLIMEGCNGDDYHSEPVPVCVAPIFPANSQLVPENTTIRLSWTPTFGAQSYDVYVGTNGEAPVRVAENLNERNFDYEIPSGNDITYSWYVQPKNSRGKFTACDNKTTIFKTQSVPAVDEQQRIVNVLVLDYDPYIVTDNGKKKLHEHYTWSDPNTLAAEYIQDVLTSSHNLIKYNIVEWKDIDEFPRKADGFRYTASTYSKCIGNHGNCHSPDDFDYVGIFKELGVVEGINQNLYDEVWIFGGPYFGTWESAMGGPGAFEINGGVYRDILTNKAFAIMGFNYERGVAEMMHNLCHRTEATMSKVYHGWQAEQLTTPWARFAANFKQSGVAAVGTCHYPPNAMADYDYMNDTPVASSADDWFTYPVLTGKVSAVSSSSWGAPDYQRRYLNWWFNHLPHRVGRTSDGRLNCWWQYIYNFNEEIL